MMTNKGCPSRGQNATPAQRTNGAIAASRFGGCMALSNCTPIPTPDGWTTLKDVVPGQKVFDHLGRECNVVAVCQREAEPVFRVNFDDDSYLLAGAQHPWVTMSHRFRHRVHRGILSCHNWASNFAPATTEEIRGNLVYRSGTLTESMYSIPVAESLHQPFHDLAIDPYLLGLWLGDGSSVSPMIFCHKDDEPHYSQRACEAGENWRVQSTKGKVLSCVMTRGPLPLLTTRLRDLGVLGNKHVPSPYLRASYEQRLALLRGLMDSDGHIAFRDGLAEFTSTSEPLARDTFELAISLRQKATISKGNAMLEGRWISYKWRITFAPTDMVVSLPRKVDILKRFLEIRMRPNLPRTIQRYIRSVEDAGINPTTCIIVDSPCRMLLAGRHMIPVRAAGPSGTHDP